MTSLKLKTRIKAFFVMWSFDGFERKLEQFQEVFFKKNKITEGES